MSSIIVMSMFKCLEFKYFELFLSISCLLSISCHHLCALVYGFQNFQEFLYISFVYLSVYVPISIPLDIFYPNLSFSLFLRPSWISSAIAVYAWRNRTLFDCYVWFLVIREKPDEASQTAGLTMTEITPRYANYR